MTEDYRPTIKVERFPVMTYDDVLYVDGMTLYRLAGNVDYGFTIIELPDTHLDPRGGDNGSTASILTSNQTDFSCTWTLIMYLFASRQAAMQEAIDQLTESRNDFARMIDKRNADIERWQQQKESLPG